MEDISAFLCEAAYEPNDVVAIDAVEQLRDEADKQRMICQTVGFSRLLKPAAEHGPDGDKVRGSGC